MPCLAAQSFVSLLTQIQLNHDLLKPLERVACVDATQVNMNLEDMQIDLWLIAIYIKIHACQLSTVACEVYGG